MEKDKTLFRLNEVIHYLVYALTVLLTLRFLLKLFGANAAAAFTDLIYSLSGVFLWPFQYVFPTSAAGGSVFEWNTLLAIFVYWVLAEGLIKLIASMRSVRVDEVQRGLQEDQG